MSAAMTGKEGDLFAFERAEHVYVRRRAERGVLREFMYVSKPGHVVEPAASNDANVCLRQNFPLRMKVVGEA
jgi:hypothetical protein